jgi:hypothetical protein
MNALSTVGTAILITALLILAARLVWILQKMKAVLVSLETTEANTLDRAVGFANWIDDVQTAARKEYPEIVARNL